MTTSVAADAGRLRRLVRPLAGSPSDFDPVVEAARTTRYVLIGEASHGTHEFYRIRGELTKRLIGEAGFTAIAIEGDWPDAHRVHRYVTGSGSDTDATDALQGFSRFPAWMWRNADVLDFIGWLRSFNESRPSRERVGLYGLDLYSLYASIEAVIAYLDTVDPAAAERAKVRYGCFDRFGRDVEDYARAVVSGIAESCRNEALAQLRELQQEAFRRVSRAASSAEERQFIAEQNARVVAGAEEYYRTMLDAGVSSWNLRDQFMFDTLVRLATYLDRRTGKPARIAVWAHNSHVGDARATTMGGGREFNIGQLVREAYPADSYLLGFTTATGTVTAASRWGGEPERKVVRAPVGGSWEALFHAIDVPNFALDLRHAAGAEPLLHAPLLERAIGVLYLPRTELYSHYFSSRICEQFDAVFHYDHTRAVEPLERSVRWETGELPETFPTGV